MASSTLPGWRQRIKSVHGAALVYFCVLCLVACMALCVNAVGLPSGHAASPILAVYSMYVYVIRYQKSA